MFSRLLKLMWVGLAALLVVLGIIFITVGIPAPTATIEREVPHGRLAS
ncbi:MAG: hypothetical protein GY915_07455 [bacterium]|nr:hypothetical protein [bacterium]